MESIAFSARAAARARLVLLLALALSGCSSIGPHRRVKGDLVVDVSVDDRLNRDAPVPVDLLLVYDEALVDAVGELSAEAWFSGKDQFLRDNQEGVAFDLWSWEWVPGQEVGSLRIPGRSRAVGGVVFARYTTPGEHRRKFNPKLNLVLQLGEEGFRAWKFQKKK